MTPGQVGGHDANTTGGSMAVTLWVHCTLCQQGIHQTARVLLVQPCGWSSLNTRIKPIHEDYEIYIQSLTTLFTNERNRHEPVKTLKLCITLVTLYLKRVCACESSRTLEALHTNSLFDGVVISFCLPVGAQSPELSLVRHNVGEHSTAQEYLHTA